MKSALVEFGHFGRVLVSRLSEHMRYRSFRSVADKKAVEWISCASILSFMAVEILRPS